MLSDAFERLMKTTLASRPLALCMVVTTTFPACRSGSKPESSDEKTDEAPLVPGDDGQLRGQFRQAPVGVVIGEGGRGEDRGSPVIGDNVFIGVGAKIIGKINEEWIEKSGKGWDEIDKAGRDFTLGRGNKVVPLSKEENERWAKAVMPLLDEYVNNMKGKGLPGDEALKFCMDYLKKIQ
jgi:hypothetical protein